MINISQHLFVPTVQYIGGYYNSTGTIVSDSNYATTPIQSYPYANSTTGLVNKFMVFSNTNNKLRTWNSNTMSSQTTSTYNVDKGVPSDLATTVRKWTFPVLKDEYMVQLLMWKELVNGLTASVNNIEVLNPSRNIEVESLFQDSIEE